MKLRSIILTLTSLAFLLSVLGGYFYYSNLKLTLSNNANQLANYKITDSKGRFTTFIAEQLKPVRSMAGINEIRTVLEETNAANLGNANKILDLFKITLGVETCYIMDINGLTIASSNRLDSDSFVEKSFAFRPYFQEAIRGSSSIYMALGTTSLKRGVYYSFPVLDSLNRQPIGVVVIKASLKKIEEEFTRTISKDETLLLTDPHGIIFITSNNEWLFHSVWNISEQNQKRISESRQFGTGPWTWLGFQEYSGGNRLTDSTGNELLFFEQHFEPFPDWRIIYIRKLPSTVETLLAPFQQTPGLLLLLFFLLIFVSVVVLFKKAHSEITRRKEAEQSLSASEERYRRLYFNTPALLHSIDPNGKILSVSDYWSEIFGYDRDEVIGRTVTDFMTPESKKRAENVTLPQFFQTGFCKDIAYTLVKKSGKKVDVLLSAIAEYDDYGKIIRSLAVLADITDLKQTETKLKEASEELSQYSQDLERQVRERTSERSSILQYMPAAVFLKDTEGRYQLINCRFEKIFGFKLEEVRGKRDRDIFDQLTAKQIEQNDRQVLESLDPLQIEEIFQHKDGIHTYLSMKFPLFDESENLIGLGCISTDITDLKDAHNKLRLLSNKIISSQERERAAIARELHDELGQALTALRMDAVWLANKLRESKNDTASRADAMSELIDKTIGEVRNMAVRLRPSVLDDLGLIAALEWLVDDFEKRLAIPCTFRHQNIPFLNNMFSTAVYRITQEALTNAARHADASHVNVTLTLKNDELYLVIQDDGKGFSPASSGETEGLGLAGIRERASLIGAKVAINSGSGKGSSIEVSFVLANVSQ